MNLSPITVIGNITADPELAFLGSGTPKLTFSVAVNHVWYDDKNEKQEKVSFVNVTAWRYLAENIARSASKGVGVIVHGRLEQRTYEKDGEKKSITEIVAEEVGILVRSIESIERRNSSEGGTKPAAKPAQRPLARVGSEEEPF